MATDVQQIRRRVAPWVLVYRRKSEHLFFKLLMYLMLINIAFAFLLPIFYMTSTSLMTIQDYVDPAVYWIPTVFNWENFTLAYGGMNYTQAFKNSIIIASLHLGPVITCAMAGYGRPWRVPGS